VARVLITGMSGAGKSTLLATLAALGYPTVDTDYDDWQLPSGLWDEPRMDAHLARNATVAVSGTAENQGRFYDRFEHVVYLLAPVEVLLGRTAARTDTP
jgi:shikimate kinase